MKKNKEHFRTRTFVCKACFNQILAQMLEACGNCLELEKWSQNAKLLATTGLSFHRSLQNRRNFLRILGEQERARGEDFPPPLPRDSRSLHFRLCNTQKITPVLQANVSLSIVGLSSLLLVFYYVIFSRSLGQSPYPWLGGEQTKGKECSLKYVPLTSVDVRRGGRLRDEPKECLHSNK